MKHVMKTVVASLSAKQRTSLKKHSAICLFVVIMTIVQEAAFTRFHVQTNSFQNIDQTHMIMDWLRFLHILNSWLIGGCCVFAFLIKAIKCSEENYFIQLEKTIPELEPSHLPRLVLEGENVIHKRRALIKSFGIIPCLWLLHILISAPVVVLRLNSNVTHILEKTWGVLPLINNVIAVGFVIYQCDACSHLTKKRMKEIKIKLFTEQKDGDDGTVCERVRKKC